MVCVWGEKESGEGGGFSIKFSNRSRISRQLKIFEKWAEKDVIRTTYFRSFLA